VKKRVMKRKVSKKVMKKGAKRAKRKSRPLSDLSPRAVRGGDVQGGSVDMFLKISPIKGESKEGPRQDPGPIMRI
jgi:hypothetical protein